MKNLFISDSGDLIRNSDCAIVREKYSYTFAKIENRHQLRATIRAGQYAWPGGYPLYLIFGDGEPCCFDCANKEYARIARDMKDGFDASFQILGCEINWEDASMHCAHCNKRIESAHAEDEAEKLYAVIVGNIGTAYTCTNEDAARKVFAEYVQDSKEQCGRCAGENVTLTCNGEPLEEFSGFNIEVTAHGNLLLTANLDAREELKDKIESAAGYWQIMHELIEPYSTNGGFVHFDAGQANPIVGITSAPCIAERMNYDDDGRASIDGRCWYFSGYEGRDDLEELANNGRVIYTLIKE